MRSGPPGSPSKSRPLHTLAGVVTGSQSICWRADLAVAAAWSWKTDSCCFADTLRLCLARRALFLERRRIRRRNQLLVFVQICKFEGCNSEKWAIKFGMGFSFSELHLPVPVSFRAQTDQAAEQKWRMLRLEKRVTKFWGKISGARGLFSFFFFYLFKSHGSILFSPCGETIKEKMCQTDRKQTRRHFGMFKVKPHFFFFPRQTNLKRYSDIRNINIASDLSDRRLDSHPVVCLKRQRPSPATVSDSLMFPE